MSKKKNKKKKSVMKLAASPVRETVRLSQCMIVKNEENNIERALAWAKGFAFEQIVVDTGSTDKTVGIAEKLGAEVHHFKWINDFAAAKNFAMDKASGDWIAFLDADEYMSRKDTEKLIGLLNKIQNDSVLKDECEAITCSFVDLDDKGNTVHVSTHQRIFKNRPHLRYVGKIHEAIQVKKVNIDANDIKIIHTGYSQSAYNNTDKIERNIRMLRMENESDPENPDITHYLANSLLSLNTNESRAEAEALHLKALDSDRPCNIPVRQLAYDFLIPRFYENEKYDEAIKLCDEALKKLPDNIDYFYYRAVLNNKKANFKAAQDDLNECERKFSSSNELPVTRLLMPSPLPLFYQSVISAEGLNDKQGIERNTEVLNAILLSGKTQTEIAGPYIRAMSWYGEPDDKILGRLAGIYDINNPKDLMFIVRAAKESGAVEFARNIMDKLNVLMNGN